MTQVADAHPKKAEDVRGGRFRPLGVNAMCFAGIEDKIIDMPQKRRPAEPAAPKAYMPERQCEIEPEPVTRPITILRAIPSTTANR